MTITAGQLDSLDAQLTELKQLNMVSLSRGVEWWPVESYGQYLQRCVKYQKNLLDDKKRHLVFDMFRSCVASNASKIDVIDSVCDITTIKDLQVLAGKKEHAPYLAKLVDRTHTEFGRVSLYYMIGRPTDDITLLKKRQNIIKFFVEHDELKAELDTIYREFGTSENMVISLWGEDALLNSSRRCFFSIPQLGSLNDRLNRSPVSLLTKSFLDHSQRVIGMLSGVAASVLVPCYSVSVLTGLPLPNGISSAAVSLQASSSRILSPIVSRLSNKYVIAPVSMLIGMLCALNIKSDYEWARDNVILDICLKEKMCLIAQFIRHIIALSDYIQAHQELVTICPAANRIVDYVSLKLRNTEMEDFIALCSSSTFKNHLSLFDHQGKVLAAYRLVNDFKHTLVPLLMDIGEMDAFMSCATLYQESLKSKNQFCFTTFLEHTHSPTIVMDRFWNPFIHSAKAISNDIYLSDATKRNMIITGPNAGGKSTLIKAVPINLVLSQTIGMAAATCAYITPFHTIATYLNITDDISAENSLFKAQALRALDIVSMVEKTPKHAFSFVAFDEMFNGTSPKEGAAAAYSIIKDIGKYMNNICLVATHFPILTQLEKESNSFANYKVMVEFDDQNYIRYPFKLEPGIAHQNVALDILKQQGCNGPIIEEASSILAMTA